MPRIYVPRPEPVPAESKANCLTHAAVVMRGSCSSYWATNCSSHQVTNCSCHQVLKVQLFPDRQAANATWRQLTAITGKQIAAAIEWQTTAANLWTSVMLINWQTVQTASEATLKAEQMHYVWCILLALHFAKMEYWKPSFFDEWPRIWHDTSAFTWTQSIKPHPPWNVTPLVKSPYLTRDQPSAPSNPMTWPSLWRLPNTDTWLSLSHLLNSHTWSSLKHLPSADTWPSL